VIAVTQIRILGSETKVGGSTYINHARSSGREIFDVIVNGYSKNFNVVTVTNTTGIIIIPELLERGDLVQVLFKMFPTIPVVQVGEFDPADFNTDFLI
jgi:hypothetical protein